MNEKKLKWLSGYLFLTMAVSSFVSFEPAVYDLLFISFVIVGFFFSLYKFSKDTVFPLLIVCVFLLSNLLSLFILMEIRSSLSFIGITFYLAFTWIGLVGIGLHLKQSAIQFIVKGYLLSACISATIGILAYLQILPNSDLFLLFGRAKVMFKDPNVFGPFLVMPALFALSMTEKVNISTKKKSIYFLSFLILISGILLSFSRAAWGNFAISFILYLFFVKKELIRKRIKTLLLLGLVGIPAILIFIQTPAVEDLFMSRLSYQKYDDDRFDTQKEALVSAISNPFGIGPGQSEYVFQYATHSLYARTITENGVIGFLSFVLFIVVSILKSYQSYLKSKGERSTFFIVIFASLVGIAFNSFFVDTLHWRHLWVLLALAWIPVSNDDETKVTSIKE